MYKIRIPQTILPALYCLVKTVSYLLDKKREIAVVKIKLLFSNNIKTKIQIKMSTSAYFYFYFYLSLNVDLKYKAV